MDIDKKKILLITLLLIIIKSIFSILVSTPTIYTDEYIYIKMAQSFFQNLSFNIHGIPTAAYPPLYSIILAISFILKDVNLAYILMKIINAILSTLIIIPSYLIAKEFLDSKKAILIAAIIAILPMNFVFSAFIMSENLFYTLFLTSLYLIYKSLTQKNYKFDILAGIFIGLSFLTRFSGISLVVIVLVLFIYKLIKRDFFEIKKKVIMGILTGIIISPWLIRNALTFGFTLNGLLGQYSGEITNKSNNYFPNMIYWALLYSSYILIASLIIFVIYAFSNLKIKLKDEKIKILTIVTIVTIIVITLGTAQHAAKGYIKEDTDISNLNGRPIGRYVDTALPIIFILGMISYYKYKEDNKTKKIIFYISIPLLIISSQLMYFSLLPANNISLTLLGVANLVLGKILSLKITIFLITCLLILITIIINKNKKISKINPIYLLIIISLLTNIVAYVGIINNSKQNWENNSQINISTWISNNINPKSKILIDQDYCGVFNKTSNVLCTQGKGMSLVTVWIMNPISISNINSTKTDYIITKKDLELKLIKEEENIKIYKVN